MTSPPVCPFCGEATVIPEFIDIGVGFQQATARYCDNCYATERAPHDESSREYDKGGWTPGPGYVYGLAAGEASTWLPEERAALDAAMAWHTQPASVELHVALVVACAALSKKKSSGG